MEEIQKSEHLTFWSRQLDPSERSKLGWELHLRFLNNVNQQRNNALCIVMLTLGTSCLNGLFLVSIWNCYYLLRYSLFFFNEVKDFMDLKYSITWFIIRKMPSYKRNRPFAPIQERFKKYICSSSTWSLKLKLGSLQI